MCTSVPMIDNTSIDAGGNTWGSLIETLVMLAGVLERNADWAEADIEALPSDAHGRVAQAASQALPAARRYPDLTVDTVERLTALG